MSTTVRSALRPSAEPVLRIVRRAPLIVFCILAFAISWRTWAMVLAGRTTETGLDPFGPVIAAVIVTSAFGWPAVKRLLGKLIAWRGFLGDRLQRRVSPLAERSQHVT